MRTKFFAEGAARKSIGEILDQTRGIGQGFNFLRIALSVAVIFVHSYQTAYGFGAKSNWLGTGPLGPPVAATLIMFFGLSGFLITGSALRTGSLRTFLSFRLLRLVPALFFETVISAFMLGLAFSSYSFSEYLHDRRFYMYFGNIIGWIHYTLPGVFSANPVPEIINRSLWTLHPELECYAMMSVLIASGLVKNRRLMTVAWVVTTVLLTVIDFFSSKFHLQGTFPGPVLVFYFLSGIVGYHWRHQIPASKWLFLGCCIISYILLKLPHTGFICAIPVIYIMMYVGITEFPKWSIIERGDYSYGMYLYGYPIQQMVVYLLPNHREWWIVFTISLVISYIVAAFSWHFVEKPTLKLKRAFGGKVMQNPAAVPPMLIAKILPSRIFERFRRRVRL